MIPPKEDPRWKDLLTGKTNHPFKVASAGMCVARNQRHVLQDPAQMAQGVAEVHAFFEKFERILADDLQVLFG